jgi:hypothetical protein
MTTPAPWRLLLIGATGAIGSAVCDHALTRGWSVTATSRRAPQDASRAGLRRFAFDPLTDDPAAVFAGEAPFDAVCWAHGANMADSIGQFDAERHLELYQANCLSILTSASRLLDAGLLRHDGARLTMVSSIWQERARQNKLSYTVTKAAVGGIVRSMAVDLGPSGHLVNGVLPGVLQTPMTEANLTPEQIALFRDKAPTGQLPDLDTLADTILFLCSAENSAVTGQSITVDCGMSNAALV